MLKGTYLATSGDVIENVEIKIIDFACNGVTMHAVISVCLGEEEKERFDFYYPWHMEGQDFISQVEMALLDDPRYANCKIYGNS